MNRMPGDWNCNSCQHYNFGFRDKCQKCEDPRPSSDLTYFANFGGLQGGPSFSLGSSIIRPGDWYCSCGFHNYASRFNCLKCNTAKADEHAVGGDGLGSDMPYSHGSTFRIGRSVGWRSGDWICNRPGCNEHNFANRMECHRCNAPREGIN